jgi:hypothetical protein
MAGDHSWKKSASLGGRAIAHLAAELRMENQKPEEKVTFF